MTSTPTGSLIFTSGNPERPYDEVDLSSRAFWDKSDFERDKSYAVLRDSPSITWHRPFEDQLLPEPEDFGFWAMTRHEDVVAVTKNHQDFLSGPGTTMENLPQIFLDGAQSIIAIDPPRHATLRRLISGVFTPKQMRRLNTQIQTNAKLAVENLVAKAAANGGHADFVAECAALMPMNNINDMMDVPQAEREEAAHHTMVAMSWNDPEIAGATKAEMAGALIRAVEYCHGLAIRLATERRKNPGPDLVSALAAAEVDGQQLTDFEIGSFFMLLTIAGNDTTRQSTSHGLAALTEFPEQRKWLLEDLPGRVPGAVEEILRWASPIMTFRRTASRDVEWRGRQITKGDKVVMFYSSANRDARRFDRPWELDLSRSPNPHLSFGGGGIHHCLGNQLARTQLQAIFTELLTRCPDIRSGTPVMTESNFFNIVKRLPCTV
ncbi:cytochrome P450 [Sporichthya sp.]|uniref:cytochrome P450 n=1 Tax=Sporichthya sp. TaxID=65475 RepID=UPI00179A7069|nr:cytochrome P450 [Sporichthya sp.]MBA3741517.1 cytochrome P450 [Sporichthya sp.]